LNALRFAAYATVKFSFVIGPLHFTSSVFAPRCTVVVMSS